MSIRRLKKPCGVLKALKKGETTQALVKTQYGFHIIRRSTYADVKAQVLKAAGDYLAQLNAERLEL